MNALANELKKKGFKHLHRVDDCEILDNRTELILANRKKVYLHDVSVRVNRGEYLAHDNYSTPCLVYSPKLEYQFKVRGYNGESREGGCPEGWTGA
jgi:hypothetical protein